MLLQQGLHFRPSCQAVGFALEPAVFSSPLPLQNLQHPKDQNIQYSELGRISDAICDDQRQALALTVVPARPPVHWVRPEQTDKLLSPPRQSEKPKFPSVAQKQ